MASIPLHEGEGEERKPQYHCFQPSPYMPTYDYECDSCQHRFELFQSIREPVKRKCPECGKLKLRRLFGTGAGVVFKGSGFYQTDYRSDSYKQKADAEGRAATEHGSSDSSGSSSQASTSDTSAKPASGNGAAKTGGKKETGNK
jgi:putative FmdB family regulatory protein